MTMNIWTLLKVRNWKIKRDKLVVSESSNHFTEIWTKNYFDSAVNQIKWWVHREIFDAEDEKQENDKKSRAQTRLHQ